MLALDPIPMLPNNWCHRSAILEVGINAEHLIILVNTHTRLGILADTLLEEVGLALKTNHLHPLEGVDSIVVLAASKGVKETVGAELNVVTHELRVHTNKLDGEGIDDELLLDLDGIRDNLNDTALGQLVHHLGVQQAGEVTVQPLVTRDELVREAEAGHESTLLEPEDGAEGSREEDALHSREGDHAFGEAGVVGITPLECPVGLLLDARDGFDGVEEVHLLLLILDVGVDQEGVGLGVDVLRKGRRVHLIVSVVHIKLSFKVHHTHHMHHETRTSTAI